MSTTTLAIGRPQANEYDPYYSRYISLVETDDVVAALEKQLPDTAALLTANADMADFRYAPGKWSVKEIVGHLSDSERILDYRVLRIARGDKTPIEGFEQDDYVPNGRFGERSLTDLLQEFGDVRRDSLHLFRNLNAEAAARWGNANKKDITARALIYTIAGHELHHRRMLKENYFK
jgi:hypothetical protein